MRLLAPLCTIAVLLFPPPSACGHAFSGADSLAASPDSTARPLPPAIPGSVDRYLDSAFVLARTQREWIDYRSIADLAAEGLGTYLRDQNSTGQYTETTIRGSGWRSIGLARDGHAMADPASGVFNPYHLAPEEVERVEFIPGPRAFLYGNAASGGFVNFVTRVYDHDVPLTKVNYSESSYDFQWTDGTFSQNITRGVNITVGFQTHSLTGRYPNSASSLWNTRAALRVRIAPWLHALLSHHYTSTNTDLNGGIDIVATPPEDVYSATQATVRNTDSYEKINRHDVDLTLVGNLTEDPGDRTTLSIFGTWNLREYRDEENRPSPNGLTVVADHRSTSMGARLQQDIHSSWQLFSAGGELELRQIQESPTLGQHRDVNGAAWVKEELRLLDPLLLTGYLRYDHYLGADYLGYGADLSMSIGGGLSLFGGASHSRRVPSYPELFWADSTVTRPLPISAETHTLGEIGIRLVREPGLNASVSVFYRRVESPILFLPSGATTPFPAYTVVNGEPLTSRGADLRLRARVGWFVLEAAGLWLRQDEGEQLSVYPEWSGTGGLYYWEQLFDGHLDLKVGFRARMQSSSGGEVFNPASLAYVLNDGPTIGSFATVGFFLIGRIGDAYVHLMWENLPNVQAYATPYYPLLDRTLRFGIRWEFLN